MTRTENDQDGNKISTFFSGEKRDSYRNWVKNSYSIDDSHNYPANMPMESRKLVQIETKNHPGNAAEVVKFKWISEQTGCFKCKSLNGKVFEKMPNVEEISHPGCKCEVVEVNEDEAESLQIRHANEIERRNVVVRH